MANVKRNPSAERKRRKPSGGPAQYCQASRSWGKEASTFLLTVLSLRQVEPESRSLKSKKCPATCWSRKKSHRNCTKQKPFIMVRSFFPQGARLRMCKSPGGNKARASRFTMDSGEAIRFINPGLYFLNMPPPSYEDSFGRGPGPAHVRCVGSSWMKSRTSPNHKGSHRRCSVANPPADWISCCFSLAFSFCFFKFPRRAFSVPLNWALRLPYSCLISSHMFAALGMCANLDLIWP